MAEVKMPKFGETMSEGTIFSWFKDEGQEVKEGDPLFEIETDKATLEVEAPVTGTLAKISVKEGESAPIGDVVALIVEEGEDINNIEITQSTQNKEKDKEEGSKASSGDEEKSENVKLDRLQQSEKVKASPAARRVAKERGIEISKVKPLEPGREVIIEEDVQAYKKEEQSIKATPVAKKMAEEYNLDLSKVTGTGPEGMVSRQDIENYRDVEEAPIQQDKEPIALEGIRKIVAERMAKSSREAPHVTLTTKVNMSEIAVLKNNISSKTEHHITYTDILIKVVAKALLKFPEMNAHLKDGFINRLEDINLGIAVDIEDGLVVPVIRNADQMGLESISEKRNNLSQKARQGQLTTEEMQGSTFTLSNLGGAGIEIFTPIINPPEIGILGVGKITKEPVVFDDEIVISPILWLSLSFDHRAIDGAPAGRFLNYIKQILESPYELLL